MKWTPLFSSRPPRPSGARSAVLCRPALPKVFPPLLLAVLLVGGNTLAAQEPSQPAPEPALAPAAGAAAGEVAPPLPAASREAPYQFVLAKMLASEGEMGAAGAAFREALEEAPDEPYLRLEYASYLIRMAGAARNSRRQGLLEEARRQAEVARDRAGEEPAVWRTLAEVYYDLSRNDPSLQDEALGALERVVAAEPEDLESSLTLGQLYLNGGQAAAAAALFSRVAERTSGNRFVYSLLGEALMRTGRMAEAEEVLARLLALDPSSRQVRLGLAGLMSERGAHESALEILEEAPRGLRQEPEVQRRLVLELVAGGRLEEARERVDALHEEEPDSSQVLATRALVLAAQGDEAALDALLEPLAATDSHRRELAALLQQQGEEAAAERLLRDTLRRLEAAPQGDEEAARTAAFVRFQLADLLSGRGDPGTAADLVEPVARAGEVGDRRSLTIAWLSLLAEAGRTGEALEELEGLGRGERSAAQMQALKAGILLGSGREKEARRILDELAQDPEGAVIAAQTAQARQRYDLAIPILEALERSGEAETDAVFLLASAYERTGRSDRAEELFLRLLEEDPDYATALNYLGYMWAEEGQNLDRALELIRRAVEADPDEGSYLDSLGWVHYKLGEYDLALKYLQRAARRTAKQPEIWEHLGDVHAALGDADAARRAYRRALDLTATGNADQLAELEQKIEDLRLLGTAGP